MKVKFYFKPHQPEQFPRPLANVTVKHGNRVQGLLCIVDSGADFCTIPIEIGRTMLGIDFEGNIASRDIKREWSVTKGSNTKKIESIIEKIISHKVAIRTESECACGAKTGGYFYPVQIELGSFKKDVLALWTEANGIPLLGRWGIFDKMDAVVFKKKEKYGYFEF